MALPLPYSITLDRHGQTVGNIAIDRSRTGDHSAYTDAFRQTPSRLWSLSKLGRMQARMTGDFLHTHITAAFDVYLRSDTVRAKQSANLLGFEDAKWTVNPLLAPVDVGIWDAIPYSERDPALLAEKKARPFSFVSPGGEAFSDAALRMIRLFASRRYSNKHVLGVTHGQVLTAARFCLERWTLEAFRARGKGSLSPLDHTKNCEILQVTRAVDPYAPFNPRACSPRFGWLRVISPAQDPMMVGEWIRLPKKPYERRDILDLIRQERLSAETEDAPLALSLS